VTEFYNITYQGSNSVSLSDLQLAYCSLSPPNTWNTLTPTFTPASDGHLASWSGTVTALSFSLPISYDAPTPILLTVLQSGVYTAALWFSS
jgi:hypothetical protein